MSSFVLIDSSCQHLDDRDFYDHVSLVAHNCYQVGEKDHESNVEFLGRICKHGHLAMVEHHRFLFTVSSQMYEQIKLMMNPFIGLFAGNKNYVSLSLRPFIEAKEKEIPVFAKLAYALPDDIASLIPYAKELSDAVLVDVDKEGLCKDVYEDFRYVSYRIITDRGVSHEIVRHRICSFAQESTRYCNYSKNKFGSTLTFIKPLRYDEMKETYDEFFSQCSKAYFSLLEQGAKAEEARSVLPNALKTSIIVTCSIKEWRHIFDLRCSPFAHPDIRKVMEEVRTDMKERGLLQD